MYRQQIAKKNSPPIPSTTINKPTIPTPSYGSLSGTIQRATASPETLREDEWLQLDSAIGTRATNEIRSGKRSSYVPEFKGISAQFQHNSGQMDAPVQKRDDVGVSEVQPENKTGLPDNLKAGVENLSGYSLDNVKVHYNSPKPDQLQALAYAQGTDIHVAPGQEKHLPHEAWHVVQQMQGRVKPTMQMKGVQINDNAGLEKEADVMGELAKTNIKKLEKRLEHTPHKTEKRENVGLYQKRRKKDTYKKNKKRVKERNPNVVENSSARVTQFGANWEVRSWRKHIAELGIKATPGSGGGGSTESGKQIFTLQNGDEIVNDLSGYWRHLLANGDYADRTGNANRNNEETHFWNSQGAKKKAGF